MPRQDEFVLPLKPNADEVQSGAARQAAVREFARTYAERLGVRPTKLNTLVVQSNIETTTSVQLRKVGYKRDEMQVHLTGRHNLVASPKKRPNIKLDALNRFTRVMPGEQASLSGSACHSKLPDQAPLELFLPLVNHLGDPDVKFAADNLGDTIAMARIEKDLVTMRSVTPSMLVHSPYFMR